MSGNPIIQLVLDGDLAFKDLADAQERIIHHGEAFTVAALPHGMQSGNTSLMLRVNLADGKVVIVETSLAAWLATSRALEARFTDEAARLKSAPAADATEVIAALGLMMAAVRKLVGIEKSGGRPRFVASIDNITTGHAKVWSAALDRLMDTFVAALLAAPAVAVTTGVAQEAVRGITLASVETSRVLKWINDRKYPGGGYVCLLKFLNRRVLAALGGVEESIDGTIDALRVYDLPGAKGACVCGSPMLSLWPPDARP